MKKARYIGGLNTVASIRREMARLYADARRAEGESPGADVSYKLGALLMNLARLIESSDIERRLAALEAERDADPPRYGIRRAG